jgi:hypothetical protein
LAGFQGFWDSVNPDFFAIFMPTIEEFDIELQLIERE